MPNPSPPTLERATGALALLVMLVLLALTIGSHADAAPAPIIIVATPTLGIGTLPLAPRLYAPARRTPPDTLEAPEVLAAREAPAVEVLVVQPAAQNAVPATAAIEPSQLIVEPDGTVRLPGVERWMANLPPEPTAAPAPTAAPLAPRTGCAARRGCP